MSTEKSLLIIIVIILLCCHMHREGMLGEPARANMLFGVIPRNAVAARRTY